jgi:hypothetical protein
MLQIDAIANQVLEVATAHGSKSLCTCKSKRFSHAIKERNLHIIHIPIARVQLGLSG